MMVFRLTVKMISPQEDLFAEINTPMGGMHLPVFNGWLFSRRNEHQPLRNWTGTHTSSRNERREITFLASTKIPHINIFRRHL